MSTTTMEQKSGADLIAEERRRQVEREGWTAEHDDAHGAGEMLEAAVAYALVAHPDQLESHFARRAWWPWLDTEWKPADDPIRNLVKAGALIAAEIDRLQRATPEPAHD